LYLLGQKRLDTGKTPPRCDNRASTVGACRPRSPQERRLAMRTLGLVGTGFLLLCLTACSGGDNASKIVGTWEGEEKGVKCTFDCAKDGKVKVSVGGKTVKEGTYKVEGDTLKLTSKEGEKEETETDKIKELTGSKLVLEDGKEKKTIELKKK